MYQLLLLRLVAARLRLPFEPVYVVARFELPAALNVSTPRVVIELTLLDVSDVFVPEIDRSDPSFVRETYPLAFDDPENRIALAPVPGTEIVCTAA